MSVTMAFSPEKCRSDSITLASMNTSAFIIKKGSPAMASRAR